MPSTRFPLPPAACSLRPLRPPPPCTPRSARQASSPLSSNLGWTCTKFPSKNHRNFRQSVTEISVKICSRWMRACIFHPHGCPPMRRRNGHNVQPKKRIFRCYLSTQLQRAVSTVRCLAHSVQTRALSLLTPGIGILCGLHAPQMTYPQHLPATWCIVCVSAQLSRVENQRRRKPASSIRSSLAAPR